MTDFAAPRTREAADFTDRERREVVMEHEALVVLPGDVLDFLLVVRRAQRAGDQRLRFSTREDNGTVDARQDARLGPDRPNLVKLAAVEAHALVEHFVAQHLLLEAVEDVLRGRLSLRELGVV